MLEADNAKAARAQLRAQALVPLEVTQVAAGNATEGRAGFTRRVFSTTSLAVWTRQLAGLVVSGLPLERALTALGDETDDVRQRELVAHLKSEVNAGAPFARALTGSPREFDDVYRAVVAAGEQSGALGAVLERLADDLEERQALKGKLVGAIAYPAIVSVIAVVIVVFLVTYVVPQVASVFTSSKRALPGLTVAMLAISAFLRDWGWLLLAVLVCAGVGLRLMLRNEGFRQRFDAALLTVPLAGRLARGYNAARFAGTLAMLAGAGVPILKALQAAAETLSNRAMRADALDACPMNTCETQEAFDATRSARTKANAMTFVGAGGLALVGVGVWFVLTSRTPKVTEKQIVLAPQLGPDGFGVTLGGLL